MAGHDTITSICNRYCLRYSFWLHGRGLQPWAACQQASSQRRLRACYQPPNTIQGDASMSAIHDSIANDPFIQAVKYELEAIDVELEAINRKPEKTIEDKIRKDVLFVQWGKLKTKYDRAITSILDNAL
jgi:hypothetical protein